MKKLLVLFVVSCLCMSSAFADSVKNQCQSDARTAYKTAIATANDTLKSALLACNGTCAESCLTTYKTCKAPIAATLDTCLQTAETTFSTAITTCQTSSACTKLSDCYKNTAFQTCLAPGRAARRTSESLCYSTAKASISTNCDPAFKTCKSACRVGK